MNGKVHKVVSTTIAREAIGPINANGPKQLTMTGGEKVKHRTHDILT